MAGRMMMMKVLCLTVAFTVAYVPYTAAISCDQVLNLFMPCSLYLEKGGQVPESCCNSIKGLSADTKTPTARRFVCGCIHEAYKSYPGSGFMNPKNAPSLSGLCHANIIWFLIPNIDCNKIA